LGNPSGDAFRVKYQVIVKDEFGDELGNGSSYIRGQDFRLSHGEWRTDAHVMNMLDLE
jgi:hypothetical protein